MHIGLRNGKHCFVFSLFNSGRSYYLCTACVRTYKCASDGITSLKRHEASKFHKMNMAKSQATASVSQPNLLAMAQKSHILLERTKTLEFQMAMFLIKNNLPFSLADELVTSLKNIDIDEMVQKKLACNRTKCTALICAIGNFSQGQLIDILKNDIFSVIVDESTDISTTKHLVLCARYLEGDDFEVRDTFLALLEVF